MTTLIGLSGSLRAGAFNTALKPLVPVYLSKVLRLQVKNSLDTDFAF